MSLDMSKLGSSTSNLESNMADVKLELVSCQTQSRLDLKDKMSEMETNIKTNLTDMKSSL